MRTALRLRPLLLLTLAALSSHVPPAAAQEGAQTTASPYGAPPSAWTRYTYPGEEVSVEMPSMPMLTHTVRSFGRFPSHKVEKMRVFSLYSGGIVFFFVAYDRPHQSESLDAFATYLRGAWELAPKGEAAFGGKSYAVAGMTVRAAAGEMYGEARVFRARRHAYLALALSKEAGRPEIGRFLDSLTLGSEPLGERVAESESVPRMEPPPRGASADGPFPSREMTQRAFIVYKPEPGYSDEGRRNNTRGTVRLRVVLGAAGEVKDISVIKGLPSGLTEQSIAAALRMLFFPAVKDGRPVAQYVVLEYGFHIY